MSNNNSILFVGLAAAVLLCGATAGIAIACMNSDTTMTDEQLYLKGLADGRLAANNGDTYEYVNPYDALMSPYDYGYQIGFENAGMKTLLKCVDEDMNIPSPDSYEYYIYYVEQFENRAMLVADIATGIPTLERAMQMPISEGEAN